MALSLVSRLLHNRSTLKIDLVQVLYRVQTSLILALIALALSLSISSASARDEKTFRDITMIPEVKGVVPPGELRPDAQEIANILNIQPLVARLQAARGSQAQAAKPVLYARLLCDWKMFAAGEEVRKFVNLIESDLADSNITLDSLMAKQNKTINTLNTLNFAQGGILGICKQSLFLHQEAQASQYPLIVSFSNNIVLSGMTLFVPSIYRHRMNSHPNSLAHFLDPNYAPPDAARSYLWKYFNSAIPGAPHNLTRRQLLLKHWEAYQNLNTKDSALLRRLGAHPQEGDELSEGIKNVGQQVELLHDLKTHVEEFDASLYELHKEIQID